MVAEILLGSYPPVRSLDDEFRVPQPAENRRGVPDRNPKELSSGFHCDSFPTLQDGKQSPGQVAVTSTGEQVMPLIGQLRFEDVDERCSQHEEFGRGAGVLKWL